MQKFGKLFNQKKGQVISGLTSNITAFVVMIFIIGALVYALGTFANNIPCGTGNCQGENQSVAFNVTNSLMNVLRDNVVLIGVVFIMIVVAVVIFIARRMSQ